MKKKLGLLLVALFIAGPAFADALKNRREFTRADEDAAFGRNLYVEGTTALKGNVTNAGTLTNTGAISATGAISSAGAVSAGTTVAAGTTVTAGTDLAATAGHVKLNASGKTLMLEDDTAASRCVGSGTLTAATPLVVETTCVNTGDYVFLTRTSIDSDTTGDMAVTAIVDGVSFAVTSEANDTATFNWFIVKQQ